MMKIGVALGGGGAKGFAHLGVLRVIESVGLPITIVTGTSAGAIVGALYAGGKSLEEIEKIARRWSLRQFLSLDRSGLGMFSTEGIRRVIETELGREARIENLPRRFAAIAVDLDAQSEVIFESGNVADAVCASAAFPGFFAPVILGKQRLIDGGTLNPVPCDVARRLGADRVIAVDLSADEPVFTTAGNRPLNPDQLVAVIVATAEKRKIVRVTARAIGIMSKAIREFRMTQSAPDLVIYPDVQKVGLLDFDLTDECLSTGESAARAVLPQIRQLGIDSRWQRLKNAARKTRLKILRTR